ncbi:MAG: rhodanese-like domain-containing protein [Ardenticatenaceae bacterium]
MKKNQLKHSLFLLICWSLLLVACGGGSILSTNSEVPIVVADGEELDLLRDVDVQTVAAIKERDDVFLLDVREQWEYDAGHLEDITHIPTGEVANRLSEIPTDKNVIVYCASGVRSDQITNFLLQNGYSDVHDMQGGIIAWQRAGFPVVK